MSVADQEFRLILIGRIAQRFRAAAEAAFASDQVPRDRDMPVQCDGEALDFAGVGELV